MRPDFIKAKLSLAQCECKHKKEYNRTLTESTKKKPKKPRKKKFKAEKYFKK